MSFFINHKPVAFSFCTNETCFLLQKPETTPHTALFWEHIMAILPSVRKGDPPHCNWTLLDFYSIVITEALPLWLPLLIDLPWEGLLETSGPLVETCSVLRQLERWVICHLERSRFSTVFFKVISITQCVGSPDIEQCWTWGGCSVTLHSSNMIFHLSTV